MSGNNYADALSFRTDSDSYALFNLNGAYSKLNFDVGHIDGKSMEAAMLNIYLDGELSFSQDLDGEMLPTHCEVILDNAQQMKIEIMGRHMWAWIEPYALANATLVPITSSEPTTDN